MKSRFLTAPDLAKVVVFAALIAALSLPAGFHLIGSSVPVTLQTLGVMLAGSLLGPRLGPLAVLVYLAVGALGLPVFSGGAAGVGVFTGPTAGYLIAFPIAALVIGLIANATKRYNFAIGLVANIVGGIIVVYAIGVPVLAAVAELDAATALKTGATIFLPGDAIKVVLATVVAVGVHRAYPPLTDQRAARRAEHGAESAHS